MAEKFSNNGRSTLSGAINSAVTSLTVASASSFPTTGNFRIKIDSELLLVTAVSTNTFTVTRGIESTTAASHSSGATVTHVITAGAFDTFVQGTTPSGAVVGTTDNQTLSGKTLSGVEINGAVTGTYTLGGTPTFPSSVATLTGTQTLTNKTLTAPVISTISNTGTVTLPTSTDTLVGRATTDTLTNKTITSPTFSGTLSGTYTIGGTPTFPSDVVQTTTLQTLSNKTLNNPVISQISNTGVLTLPTSTDVLVGRATTDTLTNKTLTNPTMSGTLSGTYTIGGTPTFPSTVVQTTSTQTLTNKTIVAASNTITTVASGNLTSTNLNSALAELQTDLDTRPQYSTGTIASIPTSSVRTNDHYEPTDGLFSQYRYGTTQWQAVGSHGRLTDPLTALSPPYYNWYLTGSGTNEYACVLASNGNDPGLTQPGTLFINGSEATSGTVGSLAAGTWGWGSYSGFNTVHVRLSDGTDPDTKAYGYIRSDALSWLVKGNMSASVEKNHLYIQSTSNGATLTCRMRAMNVPSTPYTMYALIIPGAGTVNTLDHIGLGWSDGTAFQTIGWRVNNSTCYLTNMTNATTFNSDAVSFTIGQSPLYFCVRDDGTNRLFMLGNVPDYNRMRLVTAVTRTSFLTPTKVGIVDIRNSNLTGAFFPHLQVVSG